MTQQIAEFDIQTLAAIRANVEAFMRDTAQCFDGPATRLLDIAPQDHGGARPFFVQSTIETLDINPASGATYIADLCKCKGGVIPADSFDVVVCTEVLEHTLRPFDAVEGIFHMLTPGGVALVTTPFNFRIHGPLPDCWRFTEHGLKSLFSDFEVVSLRELPSPDRWLMPLQYTLVARKPA